MSEVDSGVAGAGAGVAISVGVFSTGASGAGVSEAGVMGLASTFAGEACAVAAARATGFGRGRGWGAGGGGIRCACANTGSAMRVLLALPCKSTVNKVAMCKLSTNSTSASKTPRLGAVRKRVAAMDMGPVQTWVAVRWLANPDRHSIAGTWSAGGEPRCLGAGCPAWRTSPGRRHPRPGGHRHQTRARKSPRCRAAGH